MEVRNDIPKCSFGEVLYLYSFFPIFISGYFTTTIYAVRHTAFIMIQFYGSNPVKKICLLVLNYHNSG